ncbi:hypothetical protein EV700_0177 [Fluviicoccus keumensis]|uniref:Uncharacterized protein n=1 Tax=Fluviicoccus keumensis TaxID=1435465 RepID=A0A4V2G6C4_9GAMM|nr:hypothetical protein [Fluviicoccus keumensis]RZU48116.1 hypothetical protein EV700_0177 [Fluviicoccus keumensis]
MPHPFGLLARGLTVAMGWWLILTVMAAHAGIEPFRGLPLRWLTWLAGMVIAALIVLELHRRDKSRKAQSLQPSHFYGVDVNLGCFPSQISHNKTVLPEVVGHWVSASSALERVYHDALCAITSLLNEEQVIDALNDCRCLHRGLAQFNYEGLQIGNRRIPPKAADFTFDKSDPLIPILCFSLKLTHSRLNQAVMSYHAIRQLPFKDQHVLTQVLAGMDAGENIPLIKGTKGDDDFSIRDDRTAALLILLKQLQPQKSQVVAEAEEPETECVNPVFQRFYDLMHETGRINGQRQGERLGFLHGERLYLHWPNLIEALAKSLSDSGAVLPIEEVADQLLLMLAEKEMLVTSLHDQQLSAKEARFKVVFTGKLGEQEHRNEFNDMLIVLWRSHFPLMSRLRNSRFTPEVMCPSHQSRPRPIAQEKMLGKPSQKTALDKTSFEVTNTANMPGSTHASVKKGLELPSGPHLRDHIATTLDTMLQNANNDTSAPIRKNTDSEGRVWLYVSLAAVREGLLEGITEADLRNLIVSETPGVICIKNQRQKRIYGFCLGEIPVQEATGDLA